MNGRMSNPPPPPPPPPIPASDGSRDIKLKTRRPGGNGWNLPPLFMPQAGSPMVPPLDLPQHESTDAETGEGSSAETSGRRPQDSLSSSLRQQASFTTLDFDVDNDPPSPPPPPLPPKLESLEVENDYTDKQPRDTLENLGLAEQPTLETRPFSLMEESQEDPSDADNEVISSISSVASESRGILLAARQGSTQEGNSPRNLLNRDTYSAAFEKESAKGGSSVVNANPIPTGNQFYIPAGIRGGIGNHRGNGPPTGQFVLRNQAPIGQGKLSIPKAAIHNAAASHQTAQQPFSNVNQVLQQPPLYYSADKPVQPSYSAGDRAVSAIYDTADRPVPDMYAKVRRSVPDTYATADRLEPDIYATIDRSVPGKYSTDEQSASTMQVTVAKPAYVSYATVDGSTHDIYATVDRSDATLNRSVAFNPATADSSVLDTYSTVERSAPPVHGTFDKPAHVTYTTVDRSAPDIYATVDRSDATLGRSVPVNTATFDRSVPNTYSTVDRSSSHSTVEGPIQISYPNIERSMPVSYATVDRSIPLSYATVDSSGPGSYAKVDRTIPASYTTIDRSGLVPYATVDRLIPNMHGTVVPGNYISGAEDRSINSIIVAASNIPQRSIPPVAPNQSQFTTTIPRHAPKIDAAPKHMPPVLSLQTDSPRNNDANHQKMIAPPVLDDKEKTRARQHIQEQPVWTNGPVVSSSTAMVVRVGDTPKKLSPPVAPKPLTVAPLTLSNGNGDLASPSSSDLSEHTPRSQPSVIETNNALLPTKKIIKDAAQASTHVEPRQKIVQFAPSTIDNENTAPKLENVEKPEALDIYHPSNKISAPNKVKDAVSVVVVNGHTPSTQVSSMTTSQAQQPAAIAIKAMDTSNGHVSQDGVSIISVNLSDDQAPTMAMMDHQNNNIHYKSFQQEGFTNQGFEKKTEGPQYQLVPVNKQGSRVMAPQPGSGASSISSGDLLHIQNNITPGTKDRRSRRCLVFSSIVIILIVIGIIAGVIIYFQNTK